MPKIEINYEHSYSFKNETQKTNFLNFQIGIAYFIDFRIK